MVTGLVSSLQQRMSDGADVAAAAAFSAHAFAREAMVSHLGVLPFDSHFGKVKEVVWGPAVLSGFESEQTIGAATIDGSLCLTHTSRTPLDELLEAMWDVLIDACVP